MANALIGHRVVQARHIPVGQAESLRVTAGQLIQVVDMVGAQVIGFHAVADNGEHLSASVTATSNSSIVLKQGDTIYGSAQTPMFELLEDSVGRHDLVTAPIPAPEPTSSTQTVLPTIRDALIAAAEKAGLRQVDLSSPINFFKHVVIKSKGELEVKESFAERGDSITLRALTDTTVIIANNYHERRPGVTAGKAAAEKAGQLLTRVYA